MCLDNSAPQSVRYLNAQLGVLWENADECSKHKEFPLKSTDYEKTKYIRALATFHYSDKKYSKKTTVDDLLFFAKFGRPELKFACNHEAVLTFTIEQGHLYRDNKVKDDNKRALSNVHVTFRLPFSRSGIEGNANKTIGNTGHGDDKKHNHKIKLLVLDFTKANIASWHTTDTGTTKTDIETALKEYMRLYLAFLKQAGNHVLFDLPDFDDDKYSPKIDYSVTQMAREVQEYGHEISLFGHNVSEMNKYLSTQWEIAFMKATLEDELGVSLALIRSNWLQNSVIDDFHFHISFSKPSVRAICSHEVLLTFQVKDIWIFSEEINEEHSEPIHQFSNWEYSFVVQVVEATQGSVTQIQLDMNTARFTGLWSTSVCDATEKYYFERIIRFMSVDYLDILTSYRFNYALYIDTLIDSAVGVFGGKSLHKYKGIGDSDDDSWSEESDEEEEVEYQRERGQVLLYSERITKMVLFGYDSITAISEQSINSMFLSLWKNYQGACCSSSLVKWNFGDLFKAEFGPLQVKLLSNGKAVIFIHLQSGSYGIKVEYEETEKTTTTEKRGSSGWKSYIWPKTSSHTTVKKGEKIQHRQFQDLTVAFEVDITTVLHDEVAEKDSIFYETFGQTPLGRENFGCSVPFVYNHLILDLTRARFAKELSDLDGLQLDSCCSEVSKLHNQTAISQFASEYLKALMSQGHHVLYSAPVFASAAAFGLTSLRHQLVSKTLVTIRNCKRDLSPIDAPAVLIMGMSHGREFPPLPVGWGACGWIISGSGKLASSGTLCLSKELFLEGTLLPLLGNVNANTTIVPKWASIDDGVWKFEVSSWADHPYLGAQGRDCKWVRGNDTKDYVEYIWEHHDGWNHEHQRSSGDHKNGEYSLSCRTTNTVHIPTAYKAGKALEMILKGKSSLRVSGKTNSKKWSKRTIVTWSATVKVGSGTNGLRVDVSQAKPECVPEDIEGDCPIDVQALHSKHLLSAIKLDGVVSQLKGLLEGNWKYSATPQCGYGFSSPVFSVAGDLILQLITPPSAKAAIAASSATLVAKIASEATAAYTSLETGLKPPTLGNKALSASSDEDSPLATPAIEVEQYIPEDSKTTAYENVPQMHSDAAPYSLDDGADFT